MQKLCIVFALMFLFYVSHFQNVYAQEDIAQALKSVQAQIDSLQNQVKKLETKVSEQDTQIQHERSVKKEYEQRVKVLEEQLAQSGQTEQVNSSQRGKAGWTPEISVVADVVAKLDSAPQDEEGADRVSVRELELLLGSAVDPFSRLDATLAFSDFEEPSLEEAYLTRFDLPGQLTARLGKFKPRVGKAIVVHRDSLDTVDEPLVIQKYFGVEGFNKAGLDLTRNLDLPWPVTHQLSVGVLEGGNGEEGTAFGESRRRPTLYGNVKNYLDLTEDTGIEGGVSYLTGSRDEDSSMEVRMLGLNTTLTHQFNARQALKLQGEAFRLGRRESYAEVDDGMGSTMLVDAKDDFWGLYGLADVRMHPRWSTGFRYDYLEPVDLNDDKADHGYTGYLTFYQSEFARWRTQFTHTDMASGQDDNALMIQGTFMIGDHKHKIQ